MNLVRKLVYVTLVMPFVYCSTPQRDTASAVIPNDLNTLAKPTQQQQLNKAGSRRQRENDDDIEAKKMTFIEARQKPLKAMLSQQLEALDIIKKHYMDGVFKAGTDVEKLRIAASAANVESLIGSTQDVIKCLNNANCNTIVIGIGATPALKEQLDSFIKFYKAEVACDALIDLSKKIQVLVADIYNPDLTSYFNDEDLDQDDY